MNKRMKMRALTTKQATAIGLLLTGKNDRETAEAIGVRIATVNEWRNHHPAFRAELDRQRRALIESGVSALEDLIPRAVAVLSGLLDSPSEHLRIRAATTILKQTRMTGALEESRPTPRVLDLTRD